MKQGGAAVLSTLKSPGRRHGAVGEAIDLGAGGLPIPAPVSFSLYRGMYIYIYVYTYVYMCI